MEIETAKSLGVRSGLEILDSAVAHVAPEIMGMGPVPAMQKVFERNKLTPQDIAAYEINEAFAIQVLASAEELSLPAERINAWGGAMAIGHPLGASGLRLVMTLHDRLAQQGEAGALGIASLCVGGGQGMALLFRYVEE
jgi:acetyl-CoA acyltransferase